MPMGEMLIMAMISISTMIYCGVASRPCGTVTAVPFTMLSENEHTADKLFY